MYRRSRQQLLHGAFDSSRLIHISHQSESKNESGGLFGFQGGDSSLEKSPGLGAIKYHLGTSKNQRAYYTSTKDRDLIKDFKSLSSEVVEKPATTTLNDTGEFGTDGNSTETPAAAERER